MIHRIAHAYQHQEEYAIYRLSKKSQYQFKDCLIHIPCNMVQAQALVQPLFLFHCHLFITPLLYSSKAHTTHAHTTTEAPIFLPCQLFRFMPHLFSLPQTWPHSHCTDVTQRFYFLPHPPPLTAPLSTTSVHTHFSTAKN